MTLAAAAAFLARPEYRVSIVLAQVTDDSDGGRLGGGLSSLAASGALAPLIGNLLPGSERKSETLATLRSDQLTQRYIEEQGLVQVLFADRWNARSSQWQRSVFSSRNPTPWRATRYFDQRLRSVYTDSKTGLTTMTIAWRDPIQAAQWANDLVRLTNEHLRDRDVADAERNITYLRDQLAQTDVVAVRNALGALLQAELRKAMLARGNREYALRVVDPARPSEAPSSPLPLPWTVAGLLFGVATSTCAVLLRRLGFIRIYAGPRVPI